MWSFPFLFTIFPSSSFIRMEIPCQEKKKKNEEKKLNEKEEEKKHKRVSRIANSNNS